MSRLNETGIHEDHHLYIGGHFAYFWSNEWLNRIIHHVSPSQQSKGTNIFNYFYFFLENPASSGPGPVNPGFITGLTIAGVMLICFIIFIACLLRHVVKWRREYLPLPGRVCANRNPIRIDTSAHAQTIPNSVVVSIDSPLMPSVQSTSNGRPKLNQNIKSRTVGDLPMEDENTQAAENMSECNDKLINDEKRGQEILDDAEIVDLDESTGFIPRNSDDDISGIGTGDIPYGTQKNHGSNLETASVQSESSSARNHDLTIREKPSEDIVTDNTVMEESGSELDQMSKENGADNSVTNVNEKN